LAMATRIETSPRIIAEPSRPRDEPTLITHKQPGQRVTDLYVKVESLVLDASRPPNVP